MRSWRDFLPARIPRRTDMPRFEVREVEGPPVPEQTEVRNEFGSSLKLRTYD
jgi:hypothetical protein